MGRKKKDPDKVKNCRVTFLCTEVFKNTLEEVVDKIQIDKSVFIREAINEKLAKEKVW